MGVPEIVLVQGLAVADYLLPGLAALSSFTRAHLLELPAERLPVADYGRAVADWLARKVRDPVILAGHSSGTQVAAEAASRDPYVAGLVLAAPMTDPAYRRTDRLFRRWLLAGRREAPGVLATQWPEWRRAGLRHIAHLVRVHRRHVIEESLRRVTVPILVLRGRRDPMSTARWARGLATGGYIELSGAHDFAWGDPNGWSAPMRGFTEAVTRRL
ncbi:alpha/beta fold hydrolase [Actinoplanes flavus]|uniref:Alpha/beta fold hydrolase n=1 Tax=Actinoplanes flavus TaxID=2820290 RepID=A0ABS3UY75_9ACTN|nr:alpha/beta fold hydrolase [Actinoplanes flavus]MBO3743481.1 alpha/beta fold hydrolase [Actinoplanes flavus]